MNLRSKIVVITILTIVLSTAANGFFNSFLFVRAYTKSLEDQSIAIGQALKQQLDRLLSLEISLQNLEGFEKQCNDLVLEYNIIKYAMVIDTKGKILFHNDPAQHGEAIKIAPPPAEGPFGISSMLTNRFSGKTILETHIPIIDRHQQFIGTIIVGVPESIIAKERNQLLFSSFFNAAFFIIAAALILFLIISQYVTQPIGNFILHIQRLKELGPGGNLSFDPPSSNEIGKLQCAFMDLMKDLDSSRKTIQKHALELEEIVEKRTEQLQQANHRLKLDIKARAKVEEALKESEERSKTIINAVQTGIIITTTENNIIVDANPMALKLLNLTMEDIKGKDIHTIIQPVISPKCSNSHFHNPIDPLERILKLKDGQQIPVLTTTTPIILNKKPHAIESFIDLRRLKTAEEDRDRLERQLRQAQKLESIGTLAGGIAHGFNNILASIIGCTELAIQDVEKGSKVEKNVQKIFTAAIRARDLVKQILAFARQTDEELQPIRLDIIAKEALKFIRSTIPVTIKINQSINCASSIMGNPTQVNQIFMNLCTNAAQAMEDNGGVLSVDIDDVRIDQNSPLRKLKMQPGDYVKIVVSDNGPGIPEKNFGLIFEPYFTTKKIGEGTGMGLAVVHGIVERYRGKITVESKPDQGAKFTIFLPVTQKRNSRPSLKIKKLPSGTERILIVDDEALIVEMGNDILGRLGYQITTCTSSLEAIELFRSNPKAFDLIITDMTMPEMTGDILAEQMLALRPDIPIILCTGYSSKMSDDTALAKGIRAFAYKPIIQEDLATTVRKVLDNSSS